MRYTGYIGSKKKRSLHHSIPYTLYRIPYTWIKANSVVVLVEVAHIHTYLVQEDGRLISRVEVQ